MFAIHLHHVLPHLPHLVRWLFALVPLNVDPLSTIMSLMNTLGSYFNTAQQQALQQQVYGQQQNALSFIQNPNQMNQFLSALTSPYSYSNIATPGTAAQTSQYLQGLQTPYSTALSQQNPSQMNSLINQYTQGLNSGLTSGVWNNVQDQLASSGMSQSPGVAAYDYSQALAPYYQQNIATAAGLAQAPTQYYQNEQQIAAQQGQIPLQYGLNATQLGLGEATNALNYPLNIGAGLAGMFPNYSTSVT